MLSRGTAAPKRLFQLAYKPIAGLHLLVWSIALQALCLVLFKHSSFYFRVFVLRKFWGQVYHPTMKHGATKSKICSGLRHDLNDYFFPFGCPAHILIHFPPLSFYCYLVALCPVTLPVCTFLENFPLQYAYTHTDTLMHCLAFTPYIMFPLLNERWPVPYAAIGFICHSKTNLRSNPLFPSVPSCFSFHCDRSYLTVRFREEGGA